MKILDHIHEISELILIFPSRSIKFIRHKPKNGFLAGLLLAFVRLIPYKSRSLSSRVLINSFTCCLQSFKIFEKITKCLLLISITDKKTYSIYMFIIIWKNYSCNNESLSLSQLGFLQINNDEILNDFPEKYLD